MLIDMKWLQEFAKDVHQNAVEHGFWEDDRPLGETFALIHAEWSEALEEHRAGRPAVWEGENGKPEGWAVELMDGVLRVLDYVAHAGVLKFFRDTKGDNRCIFAGVLETFPETVNMLHNLTAEAFRAVGNYTYMAAGAKLFDLVLEAIMLLENNHICWKDVITKKHQYNKFRPYKHGKKY